MNIYRFRAPIISVLIASILASPLADASMSGTIGIGASVINPSGVSGQTFNISTISPTCVPSADIVLAATNASEVFIFGGVDATDTGTNTWVPFSTTKTVALSKGTGAKTIYVKFRSPLNYETNALSKTITFNAAACAVTPAASSGGGGGGGPAAPAPSTPAPAAPTSPTTSNAPSLSAANANTGTVVPAATETVHALASIGVPSTTVVNVASTSLQASSGELSTSNVRVSSSDGNTAVVVPQNTSVTSMTGSTASVSIAAPVTTTISTGVQTAAKSALPSYAQPTQSAYSFGNLDDVFSKNVVLELPIYQSATEDPRLYAIAGLLKNSMEWRILGSPSSYDQKLVAAVGEVSDLVYVKVDALDLTGATAPVVTDKPILMPKTNNIFPVDVTQKTGTKDMSAPCTAPGVNCVSFKAGTRVETNGVAYDGLIFPPQVTYFPPPDKNGFTPPISVQMGNPNRHLTYSDDVAVSLDVPSSLNVSATDTFYHDMLANEYTNKSATVSGDKVISNITQMSEYAVAEDRKNMEFFLSIKDEFTHWSRPYVLDYWLRHIVSGYEDNNYDPDKEINRAELTKIALRAMSGGVRSAGAVLIATADKTDPAALRAEASAEVAQAIAQQSGANFNDVPTGVWYKTFADRASLIGAVKGYPDGTFRPDQPANRAEVLKIAIEASGIDYKSAQPSTFSDIDHDAYYAKYVDYAAKIGAISGYQQSTTTNNYAVFNNNMKPWDISADIVQLQRVLCTLTSTSQGTSYSGKPYYDCSGGLSGEYDLPTEIAVFRFQVDEGLLGGYGAVADFNTSIGAGRIDEATRDALNQKKVVLDSITDVSTIFKPDAPITRAEAVKIIAEISCKSAEIRKMPCYDTAIQ